MKTKPFIERLIIVITFVALAAYLITLLLAMFPQKKTEFESAFSIGAKPEGEPIGWELPNADDPEANITFAVDLFKLACANYQAADSVTMMVQSTSIQLNTPVTGYRYITKNADKYYYIEYSTVNVSKTDLLGFIIGFFDTKFCIRKYTDSTMDYVKVQKVSEAPEISKDDNDNLVFETDWTAAVDSQETEKPIYYSGQTDKFTGTDIIIDYDTVDSVTVSYDAEKGFYTLDFWLNVDSATTKTLPNVRQSSDCPDAVYTQLHETVEIWDNGYFRQFLALDNWKGNRGALALSSELTFRTTYYYDAYWTNINNIAYMSEMGK